MEQQPFYRAGMTFDECRRIIVESALREYKGVKSRVAESLDIGVRTLDEWIEKFALQDKARRELEQQAQARKAEGSARVRGELKYDGNGYSYYETTSGPSIAVKPEEFANDNPNNVNVEQPLTEGTSLIEEVASSSSARREKPGVKETIKNLRRGRPRKMQNVE